MSAKVKTSIDPVLIPLSASTTSETEDTSSSTPQTAKRYEQQNIAGSWVDIKYEVWKDGVYRRKGYSTTDPQEAPSPEKTCPTDHAIKHLDKITGRPCWISTIGHRIDDSSELIGLTYLQGADVDADLGVYDNDHGSDTDDRADRETEILHGAPPKGEVWETIWVRHDQICDTRKIIELSRQVFPVRTSNSKAVSDFLTDCYDANIGLVAKATVVSRAGYHFVNGKHGWLVGHHWIGHGKVVPDPNKYKLTKALRTHGSEQEWIKFTREQWTHDKQSWILRWLQASVFTAPLLRHIGERTFFVHHYTLSGGAKCVDKNTIVNTKRGLRRIGDLSSYKTTRGKIKEYPEGFSEIPGNRNITVWNGTKWATASHFFRGKSKTIRVRTRKGYEIIGTPEHPMWTPEGWVQLQNVIPGPTYRHGLKKDDDVPYGTQLQISSNDIHDYLPLQILSPIHNDSRHATNEKKLLASVLIDEAMARFIGYLIADGYNVPLAFDLSSDKEILDEVSKFLQDRFDCSSRYEETPGVDTEVNYRLRWAHGELRRTLAGGGVDHVKSRDKSIPRVILESPRHIIREFLSAYIDCEADFSKDKAQIQWSSASEQLSRETQILMLSFGIVTSRWSHVDPATNETYWTVTIYGLEDVMTYAAKIGVITSAREKQLGHMILKGLKNSVMSRPTFDRTLPLFDEVVSIEHLEEQDVYDLTIPDGHKFVANGLLSHNTTMAYICQSAWGHPKEFSLSLNRSTQTALTEVFQYISDLPLLLDETQGKTVDLSDFIMQATQEEPKSRSKQDGGLIEAVTKQWRTMIRTTGEQTMAGADKEDLGGQANRVVEVRHPGLEVEHAKKVWQWIEHPKHYGYAGIRFLQHLAKVVNDEERSLNLKLRHKEYTQAISNCTGKNRAVERQLGAIMLAEVLMLRWVYGFEAKEALDTALRDACDIAQNWMRMRDTSTSLWQRAAEYLTEHRHSSANLYADVSTPSGRAKLESLGSKSAVPLIAAYNAGVNQEETWYFPTNINKVLKSWLGVPPDRIWEEFATEGILDRSSDRIVRHRQIQGIFKGKVYVIKTEKLMGYESEPIVVDTAALSSYIPTGDEWYEDSETLIGDSDYQGID